ncbi:hypothetical protein Cgig2_032925 [Carnegiea gigantea]|uniref:Reverse transcriptase domain-containing protein n=1 Tax=Carnegiea gigantea TaxID=171969 RepID=A0A9Q1JHK9_9CARY|nr:hypothetical protein Cgig2_032925 [Carnegiea gigantea]
MCVNDLLLFCKADLSSLQLLMEALTSFSNAAGLKTNFHKSQMIIGLHDNTFPLKYLGVPIMASKLTMVECASLVEKIMARVQIWAAGNISFVGRARLINIVIFGMHSYWASIFLLPKEVTEKITQIYGNYLWTGVSAYKKAPYISWHQTCLLKSQRGIGMKDLAAWNKATIAKLTWAVAQKKEVLWVKWVHERYLKNKSWWDYTPSQDASWYWKKICKIKEEFKQAHHRLPTKQRLAKFLPQNETLCIMCSEDEEDEMHLFFTCNYAKIIWSNLTGWWKFIPEMTNSTQMFRRQIKGTRTQKQTTYAIVAAAIYYIRSARNHTIFKQQKITPTQPILLIKDQVKTRVLFLSSCSNKYSKYIDLILS